MDGQTDVLIVSTIDRRFDSKYFSCLFFVETYEMIKCLDAEFVGCFTNIKITLII